MRIRTGQKETDEILGKIDMNPDMSDADIRNLVRNKAAELLVPTDPSVPLRVTMEQHRKMMAIWDTLDKWQDRLNRFKKAIFG